MLPIGDDNTDRHLTPFVNYTLIILNILVFVFWQNWGQDIHFTFAYATVPAEILTGGDIVTNSRLEQIPGTNMQMEVPGLQPTPVNVYLTLLTSMFMHGGLAHLGGNMLYLWVFGDNLENVMGHFNYLLFYLICGVLAGLSHVFTSAYFNHSLLVPSLGASGAISGALGGYLLLFPMRRVYMWAFIFTFSVPAFLALGVWIIFQVVNGMGTLGGAETGGVAYAAHIGGFVAGFLLVRRFVDKNLVLQQQRKMAR
ncbi:MAG: rhomboid family intramembrane serine protease [Chitinophagaceae bacterium]